MKVSLVLNYALKYGCYLAIVLQRLSFTEAFGASILEQITVHYLAITPCYAGILISQYVSSYPDIFDHDAVMFLKDTWLVDTVMTMA